MATTFHLAPADAFDERGNEPYVPAAFASDGFIHCTDGAASLADTGNRYYRSDPRPYVVLVIDTAKLTSPFGYDDPDRKYPHIHGPLNREAIVTVIPASRLPDGRFLPPDFGEA